MKDCINKDKWCILCKFFKKGCSFDKESYEAGKKEMFSRLQANCKHSAVREDGSRFCRANISEECSEECCQILKE